MKEKLGNLCVLLALLTTPSTAQVWRGAEAVAVHVNDAKGRPVADARVVFTFQGIPDSTGPDVVASDGKGRAVVDGLAPGPWQVEISHPEYLSYIAMLEVRRGKKPLVSASFLEAGGRSLSPVKVKFSKGGGQPASPVLEARQPAEPAAPVTSTAQKPREPEPQPVATEPVSIPTSEPVSSREAEVEPAPEPAEPTQPEPRPAIVESVPEPEAKPVAVEPATVPMPETQIAEPEPQPVEPKPETVVVAEPTPARESVEQTPEPAEPTRPEPQPATVESVPEPEAVPTPELQIVEPEAQPVEPEPETVFAAEPAPDRESVVEPAPEEVEPARVEPQPAVVEPESEPAVPEPAAEEPRTPVPDAPKEEPDVEKLTAVATAAPPPPEPQPQQIPDGVQTVPQEITAPEPEAAPPVSQRQPSVAPPVPAEQPAEPPLAAAPTAAAAALPPPPDPGARVTSHSDGSCQDCESAEWTLQVSVPVPAMDPGSTGRCGPEVIEAARAAMQGLSTSIQLELDGFLGPVANGSSQEAIRRVEPDLAAPFTGDLAAFVGGQSPCQVVALVLPKAVRFSRLSLAAADQEGMGNCAPGQSCSIGEAAWIGSALLERGPSATIVYGLFENRSTDRGRRAILKAYYRPPNANWKPRLPAAE